MLTYYVKILMTNKPKLKNCVFEPVILPCYFKLGRFTYTIIGLNLNERMQFCIFLQKRRDQMALILIRYMYDRITLVVIQIKMHFA